MFGTNPIAQPRVVADDYLVKEIFYTLQGEGPWAGKPAIFVRLAGCNLRCWFCDTEFDNGTRQTLATLVTNIQLMSQTSKCKNIVITGGEPMLQELGQLFTAPALSDCFFQIETAGTVWPDTMRLTAVTDMLLSGKVLIVVSPKTPGVHPWIIQYATYYKYIIMRDETLVTDGLPDVSTQNGRTGLSSILYRATPLSGMNMPVEIFVQPCDTQAAESTKLNAIEAARVAMLFGYRLTIQMHKLVDLP